MPRSAFSFARALQLVDEHSASAGLDRIAGGALFAGAAAAGPAAPAVLSLVDPKNEAVKLLAPAVDALAAKARGLSGHAKQELLVAAHTITVLSAFFDAVARQTGLDLTEEDKHRIADLPAAPSFVTRLIDAEVPFPSADHPLLDNLDERLRPFYADLAAPCLAFLSGLAGFRGPADPSPVVDSAARLYLDRMLQLGAKPPFALWLELTEHAATHQALSNLEGLLRQVAAGSPPSGYRARLAAHARAVLDERLLRTDKGAMLTPSVQDGFVEPSFQHADYDDRCRASEISWWSGQESHDGLVDYLAAYLASAASTELPLLVLGDPGAGKSLLTEVLAARLPAESFAVLRVPLREVHPGDRLDMQITKRLRQVLQVERAELEDLRQECRPCAECVAAGRICTHQARLVVLLDGFDELVQATNVTQSGFLNDVLGFQKQSRMNGVPVTVVVTSRIVVADRAEIPTGTPIVRLEPFDDDRIGRWTAAWNAARAEAAGFVPLSSAALLANDSVAVLVRDPLLLLVLAVYLAELGRPGFADEELTPAQLYRRLLDRFIERQVDKDGEVRAAAERVARQRQQRRELQVTAFGMFNRGRQHITHEELDQDLAAVLRHPERPKTLDEPLTEAQRVLSEFLFLHNATIHGDRRGRYEFLHATFGEYLVAEFIIAELTRLARVREADAETVLDDARLSSLLSHEPVSQRAPILDFAEELAKGPLAEVLADLIASARYRPDATEDRYQPTRYDPTRRRAAYLANLVLLRVRLAGEEVPIAHLAESPESWSSLVRLWRAGLPEESWSTVIEEIERPEGRESIRTARRGTISLDAAEAQLIDDRENQAAREFGAQMIRPGQSWSPADLLVHHQAALLLYYRTATPGFALLPHDSGYITKLLKDEDAALQLNDSSTFQLGRMLGREAPYLPSDVVERLVVHAVRECDPTDLAAVIAAHPHLLHDVPGLADRISGSLTISVAVVTTLWFAERAAMTSDARKLRAVRLRIDKAIADRPGPAFNESYFSPAYLTYLRQEQPDHWTDLGDLRRCLIDTNLLDSIEPEDAVFLAGNDAEFARRYLSSRNVAVAGEELAALRAYAQNAGVSSPGSAVSPTPRPAGPTPPPTDPPPGS